MEDGREMIKSSSGGQHWNHKVPEREDKRKCREGNESRNFSEKLYRTEKHKFPDREGPMSSQHSG